MGRLRGSIRYHRKNPNPELTRKSRKRKRHIDRRCESEITNMRPIQMSRKLVRLHDNECVNGMVVYRLSGFKLSKGKIKPTDMYKEKKYILKELIYPPSSKRQLIPKRVIVLKESDDIDALWIDGNLLGCVKRGNLGNVAYVSEQYKNSDID